MDFISEVFGTSNADTSTEMMEDAPSILLFVGLVILLSFLAVIFLPRVFRGLRLRHAVPGLAIIGPLLALTGTLIGTGAMTLSGREIWFSLIVSVSAVIAALVVGLQLANPVARDLGQIGSTVRAVAAGDRLARTEIDRPDEVGTLAAAVDGLAASLHRAELERSTADDERNAVVSALSHDLRTPLASLLVCVDAIEDGVGDAPSHLKAMRGNVLALERLVEDLFLLARADSGSLELNFEPLDLAELVDDAVEAIRPVANQREVAIVTSLGEPIFINGDHTALGRVFRNLLENAVRHSPVGGIVSVQFGQAGSQLRVTVVDEGDGFHPDFVPRALDRFSQADDSRTVQGAAGLGLAIADTLIAAHHGQVVVRPGPGGRVEVGLELMVERSVLVS